MVVESGLYLAGPQSTVHQENTLEIGSFASGAPFHWLNVSLAVFVCGTVKPGRVKILSSLKPNQNTYVSRF